MLASALHHVLAPPPLQVAALSNAAGVGGGAVFVPLFCILLSMDIKAASALSQAAIAAGAAGSVACSLTRRHPAHPTAPLIAFDVALALLPLLLLGVSCGVLINLALPAWLVTVGLIPLLTLLALRTMSMGLRMHSAERQLKRRQQERLRSVEGQPESGLEAHHSQPPQRLTVELSSRDVSPAESPAKRSAPPNPADRAGLPQPDISNGNPGHGNAVDLASSAWQDLAAGADEVRPGTHLAHGGQQSGRATDDASALTPSPRRPDPSMQSRGLLHAGTAQDACCQLHIGSPEPKAELVGGQQAAGGKGSDEPPWPCAADSAWPKLGQTALLWLGFAAVQVMDCG